MHASSRGVSLRSLDGILRNDTHLLQDLILTSISHVFYLSGLAIMQGLKVDGKAMIRNQNNKTPHLVQGTKWGSNINTKEGIKYKTAIAERQKTAASQGYAKQSKQKQKSSGSGRTMTLEKKRQ